MRHKCKNCGSTQIRADRQLRGRLVCAKCGSFKIGYENRLLQQGSNIIKPFRSNNINPIDYQYIIISFTLAAIWIASDLLALIDKNYWMSWSGMMTNQPHRFLTSALVHMDVMHLIMNLGGIIIARAIFMQIGMRCNYLFILLTALLIPLSSALQWVWEIMIVSNPDSATLGFSGVVYGIDAFLLLATIKGKDKFLAIPINLKQNFQAKQTMITLTVLGQVWNIIGGVSVVAHQAGLIAGLFLFLL